MQKNLVVPVDKKTWECKNITKEEADSINSQIQQTQQKINDLENKMSSQEKC